MKLVDAIGMRPREVAAFVGAGGKTQSMFRLANEMVQRGLRVLTTTTTRIGQDELALAPHHLALGDSLRVPDSLAEAVRKHRHVFIYSCLEENNKVRGVTPAWLDKHLAPTPLFDALLVEADGSRRMPMKAPLAHEPAMPRCATAIIAVVGLDALGLPLDEEHIYGAQHIQHLIGHPAGAAVTPELIAAALLHPRIALKNAPPGARIAALLNKATAETLPAAREIARRVLTDLHVERVLIGTVEQETPVLEAHKRIAAIVLAAGQSTRMGKPKVLLPWGDGSTIIRHVCETIAGCGQYETVVVAGEWEARIKEQVAGLPVRVIYNPEYAEGEMISSLKAGLRAVWETSDAALVVLGDQPAVEPEIVRELMRTFAMGRGRIVAPAYRNRRGHPLIIDREFWQALLALPASAAPRDLLRAHQKAVCLVPVESDSVLRDIDTPDDYEREQGGSPTV